MSGVRTDEEVYDRGRGASGEPVQARAGCGSGCLVCPRQRLAGTRCG